jgi:hypothetical protein
MKTPIILSTLLIVSGCSTFSSNDLEPITVIETPLPDYTDPTLDIPKPAPIEWNDMNIIILTPDTTDEEFDKLEDDQRVFFAVTDNGYESMSLNFAELKRYIKDQNNIIIAYKKYFEEKK